jgi:hypothetical protein
MRRRTAAPVFELRVARRGESPHGRRLDLGAVDVLKIVFKSGEEHATDAAAEP